MEEQITRPPVRRRSWTLGLVCFALGMAAMWGLQHVDVLSIFRTRAASKDELARAVFEALRDRDHDAFGAYVPDLADFEKYVAHVLDVGSERDRRRTEKGLERDGGAAGANNKIRERARSSFAETLDRSRRAGLDWSNAVYVGLDQERTRIKERYGWLGGDVCFVVQSGSETFEFKLDSCMCLDGDWMIGGGVSLRRGGASTPDRVARPETVSADSDLVRETAAETPEAGTSVDRPDVGVPEIEMPRDPGR